MHNDIITPKTLEKANGETYVNFNNGVTNYVKENVISMLRRDYNYNIH